MISGKGVTDSQEEVFVISEAVCHPFDHFNLVVNALYPACSDVPLSVCQDAVDSLG